MLFKDYLDTQMKDPEFKELYNELENNNGKFNDELNEELETTQELNDRVALQTKNIKTYSDKVKELQNKWVDLELEDDEFINGLNEIKNKLINSNEKFDSAEKQSLLDNIDRFINRLEKSYKF